MPEAPPRQLTALLERLGIATPADVARMAGRVRRLARDLPRFQSVWVDALSQARVLTPYQAAEINAGRGERLRVGPLVIRQRLTGPAYIETFLAEDAKTKQRTRLAVIKSSPDRAESLHDALRAVAKRCDSLPSANSPASTANNQAATHAQKTVGRDANHVWISSPWREGQVAAKWLVHNGRFPPEAVLYVAQSMVQALADLEARELSHGDLCAVNLLLTNDGDVVLLGPGIRGVVRPVEGHARADLPPEAYDYLAPERVIDGTAPTAASDLYACGCLWWHLLCGRPPLPGGDSLAKIRSAQTANIPDVRRFAPDTPGPLVSAIAACLRRQPGARPESFRRLAAQLGAPTRCGRLVLAECLTSGKRAARLAVSARALRQSSHLPVWSATVAGCVVAAAALLWPAWGPFVPGFGAAQVATQTVEDNTAITAAKSNPTKQTQTVNVTVADAGDPGAAPREFPGPIPASQLPLPAVAVADETVMAAGYQPLDDGYLTSDDRLPQLSGSSQLVPPADKPLKAEQLELQPGQWVHPPQGQRLTLLVPPQGMIVDVEDVQFENIDFVSRPTDAGRVALVRLRASRATFRGCTFQAGEQRGTSTTAIRWDYPTDDTQAALALPSGGLRLTDCVLRDAAVGIDCHTVGAVGIALSNTLHLGGGPLVCLDHCPKAEEPLRISLRRCTLRDSGPLVACRYANAAGSTGELTIHASGCAFVPRADQPLLMFAGPASPEPILHNARWTGEGSLLVLQTPVVCWALDGEVPHAVDESAMPIEGLVRSKVDFGGPTTAPSQDAHELIRWQAPLRSADAPGIDPNALPPIK